RRGLRRARPFARRDRPTRGLHHVPRRAAPGRAAGPHRHRCAGGRGLRHDRRLRHEPARARARPRRRGAHPVGHAHGRPHGRPPCGSHPLHRRSRDARRLRRRRPGGRPMNDWAGLVWLVVLLLANAFFVGGEFAVISARRSQIEPLAERGSRSAKTALYAMEHATLMLATSQLGITICSLLILNVSEPAIHHLLGVPMHAFGWADAVVDLVAFIIALLLVSYLHVVFGEMVPKNLAFSIPDRAVLILAPPLVWVSKVFMPVIWVLNAAANGVLRLFRVEP